MSVGSGSCRYNGEWAKRICVFNKHFERRRRIKDHSTLLAWAFQKVFILQVAHWFPNDLISGKFGEYASKEKYCFKITYSFSNSLVICSLSTYCVPKHSCFQGIQRWTAYSLCPGQKVLMYWGRQTYKLII